MFVHSVYFWLKDDLTDARRQEFREAVEALVGIDTVEAGFVGTPAQTRRPIIDDTYSVALTLVFQDKLGHDGYSENPAHVAFVERYGPWFEKVLIYDAD